MSLGVQSNALTKNKCVQKQLFSRTDCVKGIDFHPTELWLLTDLYNNTSNIYNHETGAIARTFMAAVVVASYKLLAKGVDSIIV